MRKSILKRTLRTTSGGRDSHRQVAGDEYRASSSSQDEKLFSQDQLTHASVAEALCTFSQNARRRN